MHVKPRSRMSQEEFLALPDDGVRRWLVDGELREWPTEGADQKPPMTVRNRRHSRVLICIGTELDLWMRTQPEPRGQVVGGEAGFVFSHDPWQIVGIDLAVVPRAVASRETEGTTLFDGIPLLAVEILSPSDTIEGMTDRVAFHHGANVPLVWMVEPILRTVTVHALGSPPRLVAGGEELACEPHLPGFRVPVARLFA